MNLTQVLEALLFAAAKPLSLGELRAALKSAAEFTEEPAAAALARSRDAEITAALAALAARCHEQGHAFRLVETGAGWQFATAAPFAPWVRQLYPESRPARLSAPALETLALVAYRQPIARADIEAVRGVDAGGVLQTLLDRGLVRIAGRAAEVPGRPLLYATSGFFLEHFGLKTVDELPNCEELRRVPLPTVAAAATEEETKLVEEATKPQEPSFKEDPNPEIQA